MESRGWISLVKKEFSKIYLNSFRFNKLNPINLYDYLKYSFKKYIYNVKFQNFLIVSTIKVFDSFLRIIIKQYLYLFILKILIN